MGVGTFRNQDLGMGGGLDIEFNYAANDLIHHAYMVKHQYSGHRSSEEFPGW